MKKIKIVLGILIVIASWIFAAYLGGYVLFIKPIINACIAFDNGNLTALIIGTTVLKCLFASATFSLIAYLGSSIGLLLLIVSNKRGRRRYFKN